MYPVNNSQHSILQLRNSPEVLCQHVAYCCLSYYSGTFHLLPCSSESETVESCADATQNIFSKLFVGGRVGIAQKKSQAENNNKIFSLYYKGVESSISSMWQYRKNSWALPTEPKSRVF